MHCHLRRCLPNGIVSSDFTTEICMHMNPTHVLLRDQLIIYSGRKITESLGNVTVRGEKAGKSKGGERCPIVSLSMYSTTENIYCSQLSSVAILLQPEPNYFTSYSTREWLCSLSLSLSLLSSCGIPLPPTCLVLTVKEARSYFASTILWLEQLNNIWWNVQITKHFNMCVLFSRELLALS
jgi:hypothetical protein